MRAEPYADRCWEWPGAVHPTGYGYLRVADRRMMAHRMLYEMAVGPIPDDMIVMHACDNRLCVNPAHLRIGTVVDNVRDMDAKGRRAIGARHGTSKLTEAQVREIRASHDLGESLSSLGRRHGVSLQATSNIVHRKTWKHVA